MTDPVGAGEARMLIGGELVEAASGKRFENINPATEEVLGEVADASAADMQRAITSARRAFDESDWSTNHALRKRCLEQLQAALESEREEYREELIAEVGTPRMMTFAAQLDWPLEEALLWPAKMIDEFAWERGLPDGNMMGMLSRRAVWKEPIGVIGAIVPWNYPLEVTLNKLGPILATGNTVIIKPAPDTPWNATRLGRLVAEKTDIPPGVVNVVTSADHLVGEELTVSPLVDMISFTGSTLTGTRIMEKGAPTLKKTFLELGGKSAMIVLDDADFATAVPGVSMVCVHGGQGCAMQTRMLLPRSRYDEGVELISAAMAVVPYGDPSSDAVVMGPLISARQRDRVLGYIERGQEEGAKLVVGGGRPGAPAQGLVRRAHALRRRGQLHDDRPGGDLRAGVGGHPLRGRRRRGPDRQREQLRAVGRHRLGLRGAGHRAGPPGPDRVDERQRWPVVRGRLPLWRLQGERCGASVRDRGPGAVPRDQGHRLAAILN